MNFEFPLKNLPAVMRGPRIERRRVLIGGSAYWAPSSRTTRKPGAFALTTAAWWTRESCRTFPL